MRMEASKRVSRTSGDAGTWEVPSPGGVRCCLSWRIPGPAQAHSLRANSVVFYFVSHSECDWKNRKVVVMRRRRQLLRAVDPEWAKSALCTPLL